MRVKTISLSCISVLLFISAVFAADWYYLKDGFPMARSKAVLEQAVKYANQGDKEAYASLVQSGQLAPTKGGVQVYIDDYAGVTFVCVRPKGQTGCAWTLRKALEK